jgi:hypothetical protein
MFKSLAPNTRSDDEMLAKYGLKANDAILAEAKHLGIYEDLIQNRNANLVAGGAAQNTARGAQVGLESPTCPSLTICSTFCPPIPSSS